MTLPAGPGAPAADAREAFAEATAACRDRVVADRRRIRERLRGPATPARPPEPRRAVSGVRPARSDRPLCAPGLHSRGARRRGDAAADTTTTASCSAVVPPRCSRRLPACRSMPPSLRDDADGLLLRPTPAPARGVHSAKTGACCRTDRDRCTCNRNPRTAPWRLVAAVHREPAASPEWRAEYRDFVDGLPTNDSSRQQRSESLRPAARP